MKHIILCLFLSASALMVNGQILKKVTWSYAAKKTSKTEAVIYLKATIADGWHLYSQTVKEGGPIRTSFVFAPSKGYTLVGKTVEPKPITKYEESFKMDLSYFEKSVVFSQKISLKSAKVVVKGTLEFMTCDDKQCLPPEEINFTIPVQ